MPLPDRKGLFDIFSFGPDGSLLCYGIGTTWGAIRCPTY